MKVVTVGLREQTLDLIEKGLSLPEESFISVGEENFSTSLEELSEAGVLLVGEKTRNPIQIAQQVFAHDSTLSVLLINDPPVFRKIKQALLFTPFIGPTVQCLSNAAGIGLAEVVKDHVQRTQQRRTYKKTMGTVGRIFVSGTQNMERVKADYLNRLLEEAPVGLLLINKSGSILSFNKFAAFIFNKSEREVLGTPVTTLFPERCKGSLTDFFREQVLVNHKKRIDVSNDSGPKFLEIALSLLDKDDPAYKIAMVNDITDQVLAQKSMEESSQKVRMIVDSMPEMAWTGFPNGEIDYLNKRWYEYTGQVKNAHANEWWKAVHPEDIPEVNKLWEAAFRKGNLYQLECRYFRALDQKYRWHLTRALPVRNKAGEILHWVGTCTDIQILKDTEEKLQKTAEELAASNEELTAANEEITANNEELFQTNERLLKVNSDLDNFIYTASHDLKAPISNIEGLVLIMEKKLAQNEGERDQVPKILDMIKASIKRFQRTISDLTEIGKLQRLAELPTEQIILSDIIKELELDLAQQIQEADAQLEIQVDENSEIFFSRKNLKSIIYNLLSNAIKYRSPDRKPKVHISFTREGNFKVFTVADNGLGMEIKDEAKIFGMFQRLHSHVEGTGIGLYIVKKIIENAGGKITLESKPGEGSTFRVFFPVK